MRTEIIINKSKHSLHTSNTQKSSSITETFLPNIDISKIITIYNTPSHLKIYSQFSKHSFSFIYYCHCIMCVVYTLSMKVRSWRNGEVFNVYKLKNMLFELSERKSKTMLFFFQLKLRGYFAICSIRNSILSTNSLSERNKQMDETERKQKNRKV